jgi:hypothetical protein
MPKNFTKGGKNESKKIYQTTNDPGVCFCVRRGGFK